MKNFSIGRVGIAVLALLLSQPISGSQAQEQKLHPLKIGVLKIASLTNAWVAKQQGIFAKHGLDVTLVEFKNGNEEISAHRSGAVDIVQAPPGTVITAVDRGFDLVAIVQNEIAHATGPDSGSLQVLKDSPFHSLKDLAEKRIAVSGLHSQKTVSMGVVFQKAGVDPSKLKLMELPFPSHFDALKSKQVDAADLNDPFSTQVLASGQGRVIAWDYADAIPEQPLGAWFVKSSLIKSDPAVVDEFRASLKESIDYMNADPERAKANVVAYTGLSADLVKDMPMIGWSYKVRRDKWQAVLDMMYASGVLKSKHSASDGFADLMKPDIVE